MNDVLDLIIQQLDSYHLALDLRQNAGTAAQNFASNVEKILNRPYVQGEVQANAGKPANAHARGPQQEETA